MNSQTAAGSAEHAVSLRNDCVSLEVLPGSGGLIASLTDRRTGRNWLWRNPHIAAESRLSAVDYGKSMDAGGWDEVLLSVSPDRLALGDDKWRAVPDHGDLVRASWRPDGADAGGCRLVASGTVFDYRFSREIRLAGDRPRIEFDYALTNNESYAWPWYWCAHALIDVQPGMHIGLPDGLPFRVDSSTRKPDSDLPGQRWPNLALADARRFNLSNSFQHDDDTLAGKLFVQSPHDGSVTVTAPNGKDKFTMIYDPGALPWLGLWINNGGWSGCGSAPYFNLGLEPATTQYDSVAEAMDQGAVAMIEAGETRRWQLAVELTA